MGRMPFLFVQHGRVDYDAHPGRFRGHGIDLLPLTEQGVRDAETAASNLAGTGIERIVASPMTRALQTAMILSWRLDRRVDVELDLHEWVPDLTQQWSGGEVPKQASAEAARLDGEWPSGERRDWEPRSAVRHRVGAVLDRYASGALVAVVCHSGVIEAMTGVRITEPCTVVPYEP
jgi:uncharacterized phosphatase